MNAEIDISSVEIKTDRLLLRPWKTEDLDDFFEYASVEGVGEMAGWGHHRSKEESAAILERFIKGKRTFAIELQNGFDCKKDAESACKRGKVIGSIGLETLDSQEFPQYSELPAAELGFVLSKDYWNQGIMTEAVSSVIEYLFTKAGLEFLVCRHFDWNNASEKVQKKNGFKPVFTTKRPTQTGRFENTVSNILTKEMWFLLFKSKY